MVAIIHVHFFDNDLTNFDGATTSVVVQRSPRINVTTHHVNNNEKTKGFVTMANNVVDCCDCPCFIDFDETLSTKQGINTTGVIDKDFVTELFGGDERTKNVRAVLRKMTHPVILTKNPIDLKTLELIMTELMHNTWWRGRVGNPNNPCIDMLTETIIRVKKAEEVPRLCSNKVKAIREWCDQFLRPQKTSA